jgi:hypothetical protein
MFLDSVEELAGYVTADSFLGRYAISKKTGSRRIDKTNRVQQNDKQSLLAVAADRYLGRLVKWLLFQFRMKRIGRFETRPRCRR